MAGELNHAPETTGYDDASWLLVVLCLLLVTGFQLAEPFSFAANGVVKSVVMIGALCAGWYFYSRYRVRPQFATLLLSMAQVILFSILAAVLTYMVAAHGGGLWDDRLARWDRALGLDWRGYVGWVDAHPAIGKLYRWAYMTMIPQLLVLMMALSIAGKQRMMRVVICAAILSGTASVLMSGLTPAVSNFVYLGLTPGDFPNLDPVAAFVHRADFMGLRDGSLRHIDITRMQGIVTFPSYHAALGAILIRGFVSLGRIGWIGAIWAGIMLLATPVDGAHYFVDVFAGIGLAAAAIFAAGWLVRKPWIRMIRQSLHRNAAPSPASIQTA